MAIKTRNKVEAGFNMSSMTDVVFLLLIFFMITSTLVTSNAFKVKLPKGVPGLHRKEAVDVVITSDGKFYLGQTPVEREDLATSIKTAMANNPEASLVVHGDEAAAHGDVVQVMMVAYENKYNFVIATGRK